MLHLLYKYLLFAYVKKIYYYSILNVIYMIILLLNILRNIIIK